MSKPVIIVLMSLVVFLHGCANMGGYFVDRGCDAADIVTATAGMGVGAKARVGPVHTGLLFNMDVLGLKGGHWGQAGGKPPEPHIEVELFAGGDELVLYRDCVAEKRNKAYATDTAFSRPFISGPLHGNSKNIPPSYYTQIEATLGLLPSC